MEKNYKDIIQDLENSVKDIEHKGISIKPLNDSLDELKKHSDNIERIEKNIDAIREEVIDRIKKELEENKTAGKFSIFGFWIGTIALVFTTIQVFREVTKKPVENKILEQLGIYNNAKGVALNDPGNFQLAERLDRIEKDLNALKFHTIGFDDNYKPDTSEFLIDEFNPHPIKLLKSDQSILTVSVYNIEEKVVNNKLIPLSTFKFYLNNKQLGPEGMKECIKIINTSKACEYDKYYVGFTLSEGDIIIFFNKYKFTIERIYRTTSNLLKVADNKDAVLLRINNK